MTKIPLDSGNLSVVVSWIRLCLVHWLGSVFLPLPSCPPTKFLLGRSAWQRICKRCFCEVHLELVDLGRDERLSESGIDWFLRWWRLSRWLYAVTRSLSRDCFCKTLYRNDDGRTVLGVWHRGVALTLLEVLNRGEQKEKGRCAWKQMASGLAQGCVSFVG